MVCQCSCNTHLRTLVPTCHTSNTVCSVVLHATTCEIRCRRAMSSSKGENIEIALVLYVSNQNNPDVLCYHVAPSNCPPSFPARLIKLAARTSQRGARVVLQPRSVSAAQPVYVLNHMHTVLCTALSSKRDKLQKCRKRKV